MKKKTLSSIRPFAHIFFLNKNLKNINVNIINHTYYYELNYTHKDIS